MAMRRAVLNQAQIVGGCVFLLALPFVLTVAAVAQQNRAAGPIEPGLAVLAGNRNPKAKPEDDRGRLDSSQLISGMSIVFKQSAAQTADLANLRQEQQDARSPNYHVWLTPEQYADHFGLSPADLAKVIAWLEAGGLRVDYVSRSRTWVMFSGTAGQVQNAFQTEIHRYVVNGSPHFANASDPSIPTALVPLVLLVRGLDDFRLQPQNIRAKLAPDLSSGGLHYLSPGDVGTIYDINPLYNSGFKGSGQKVAVVGQTDIHMSDIEYFRTYFSLPSNNPELVLVQGSSDPGISSNDLLEANLDLEYSGGVAPSASILFVYSTDVVTSLAYAIDQNLAPVISMSYGGCEAESSSSPASAGAYYQSLAQQANSFGITWMAASGDTGAAGCDIDVQSATHGLAVALPSSVPEVTAVGGSEFNEGSGSYWSATNNANLSSAMSYIPEKAWNDTAASIADGDGLAATGGGASILFSKPAWQTGTGVPNDSARDVPDIAFAAANEHDPYLVYSNGEFWGVGGTSAPTPVFSGIMALLNQYLIQDGVLSQPGLGNINPTLYRMAQTTSGVFHDITVGNNIVPCTSGSPNCVGGQLGYNAGAGYDQTTGLGSADIDSLVVHWAASLGASTSTTLRANPTSILSSGSTVLTATVSAASGTTSPTGTVSFAVGGTSLGESALAGSGVSATASLTVPGTQLSSGSNLILATYTGSGTFLASSGSATVNVTSSVACTYSLNSSAASIGPGAANATVEVTAAGGCAWTATSSKSWLTIGSGSPGSGDGSVNYSAAANSGSSARTGTLTIAGQTFTVTQAPVPSPLGFVTLTPCRVVDTRTAGGRGLTGSFGPPSMGAGSTRSFPIPTGGCNVPATAQAYSLNITVVPPGPLDYLTVWPAGQSMPVVSTLNDLNGDALANAAIVPAGTDGGISLFAANATEVIIDINGYFVPTTAPQQNLAFYPTTPCRVVNTRTESFGTNFGPPQLAAMSTRSFPIPSSSCEIPSSAQAYSFNMTVVPPGILEYLSTWPTGQNMPVVSTLNDASGAVLANAAIVPAGTNGAVDVFAYNATELIIDNNGYFAPPGSSGALYFYPVPPCRVVDTRATGGSVLPENFGPPQMTAGSTRNFPIPTSSCGIPATAEAYSLNFTVVPPGPLNYITTWPTGQNMPVVSTLNDTSGTVVANAAIVPAGSAGGISVYAYSATDLIIDINGYFAP
jgi:Pro-kumamolisin, activation domain/Bacterial Ig-like domain (group 3)/Putative binding domain, N-terminal